MEFIIARPEHIEKICEITADAKRQLKNLGLDQWQKGYPSREVWNQDIEAKCAYLAVEEGERNKGYGAAILHELSSQYPGMEVLLLMESLHEDCDNMDIRIRRKGFYLRNDFYDTEYIQSTCEGAAIYDILSTNQEFSTDRWKTFVANYPMESYMDELYKAK